MYGETVRPTLVTIDPVGLSPHVRGNLASYHRKRGKLGSIPACTGKPEVTVYAESDEAVYPRMYGETPSRPLVLLSIAGLSPHVRGNLEVLLIRRVELGSIPACTGKPSRS